MQCRWVAVFNLGFVICLTIVIVVAAAAVSANAAANAGANAPMSTFHKMNLWDLSYIPSQGNGIVSINSEYGRYDLKTDYEKTEASDYLTTLALSYAPKNDLVIKLGNTFVSKSALVIPQYPTQYQTHTTFTLLPSISALWRVFSSDQEDFSVLDVYCVYAPPTSRLYGQNLSLGSRLGFYLGKFEFMGDIMIYWQSEVNDRNSIPSLRYSIKSFDGVFLQAIIQYDFYKSFWIQAYWGVEINDHRRFDYHGKNGITSKENTAFYQIQLGDELVKDRLLLSVSYRYEVMRSTWILPERSIDQIQNRQIIMISATLAY
ncbi:MAG: hypothetical protein HQK53_12315 [Oligoflexia bacterium]|nr:hypothetical protein [Oligoflexia bacterium]